MFYNLFFKISLILVIIVTFSICALKPKMHNTVLIYNSDYKIEESKNTVSKTKTIKNIEEKSYKLPAYTKTEIKKQNIKNSTSSAKNNKASTSINTNNKQPVTKAVNRTATEIKHSEKKSVEQTTKLEEEAIQWNKWHSDIQNQIMKDVKLPILPKGTIFKFSFDVDKYGKISDIKTWSLTPSLTPYAIQYIAPVIKSYQGHSILNFPQGTKRYTTTFTGGWKIADSVQYSTPKDFNDKEIIYKKN